MIKSEESTKDEPYNRYWEMVGDKPEAPVEDVKEWVQKTYLIGDKVMFRGVKYESIYEGANVWSPAGYPRGWKVI